MLCPISNQIISLFFGILATMLSICTTAQQATLIDSKSLNLPRYSNLTAITNSITSPQQGMMVFNSGTATNWYFNGSTWINLAMATSTPSEAEGFGSWGCDNAAIKAYQPVGNNDGQFYDNFGSAVSISGDYAIVGAYSDDESSLTDNGSATIFKRNNITTIWESQGKIINPNSANSDFFGISVSISGEYAIVGSSKDDENGLIENGSATIFKLNNTSNIWEPMMKLTNPNAANYDSFGYSVSISGDYAIVGAHLDDENGFGDNGSATIFKRNISSNIWESQGKLTSINSSNYDYFGYSVSISGDYAIIGEQSDDENGLTNNGSATIFKRNNVSNIWESQGKLTNINASNGDNFGEAVSISGDYAIVGAFSDNENTFTDNGSASIFKRNSSSNLWELQSKVTNPNQENNDYFGRSVSISGEYAIVGSYGDNENGLSNNGSVTIYRRYGSVWRQITKTSDSSSESNSYFGESVGIDSPNGRFIVGEKGFSFVKGIAIFGQVR